MTAIDLKVLFLSCKTRQLSCGDARSALGKRSYASSPVGRTSMCEPCRLDEVHIRYLGGGELRMAEG
jgi:hypothetical protein